MTKMEFALWLKECLPEEETVGPVGGSAGVVGAHKFTEGDYFLFPFRRVSRLRRPFVLRRARRRAGRADQPPSARATSQE